MSEPMPYSVSEKPTMLHCPQCGQAMRVATEHLGVAVACPRCRQSLEPWRLISPTPVVSPPQLNPGVDGFSWRNRWIAGALGVLLGGFGVHRFYMGFVGIGIAQIVVTIITFGIVGPIWGFIEGILCFCGAMRDVDGYPLRS